MTEQEYIRKALNSRDLSEVMEMEENAPTEHAWAVIHEHGVHLYHREESREDML